MIDIERFEIQPNRTKTKSELKVEIDLKKTDGRYKIITKKKNKSVNSYLSLYQSNF